MSELPINFTNGTIDRPKIFTLWITKEDIAIFSFENVILCFNFFFENSDFTKWRTYCRHAVKVVHSG
jgi:hypothetical protein